MMESLVEQARDLLLPQSSPVSALSLASYRLSPVPMPVLVIEADTPDGNAFNRGHFYRTILKLLGEQTYPQQMHVDIHAEATPPKRRRPSRTETLSNDDPDLREAAEAAMHRHGVRVIFVDEAHHLLYGKGGTGGSTLQEQLEWLKSLGRKTGVLFVVVGTYDLFNFGKLSGQTARRCLPVHFPRYQLEREKDCIEFQSTLLELLRRVPLECGADRWVTDHWLYFYECSVGCIGLLKDWLLRAVSTALDDGLDRLSLDCVQDHALPVDIYRQMALDAYEGEQRLNHTASNREHVWRLLQGGELIAPVPPPPPRETPDVVANPTDVPPKSVGVKPVDVSQVSNGEIASSPPIKKTRTRKKVEAVPPEAAEPPSVIQAESGETPSVTPPKRSRTKKTAHEAGSPKIRRSEPLPNPPVPFHRLRLILQQMHCLQNPNERGASGNPNRSAIRSGNKRQSKACNVVPRIGFAGDWANPASHRLGRMLTAGLDTVATDLLLRIREKAECQLDRGIRICYHNERIQIHLKD